MTDKGYFIISLDFELMWGVRDKRNIDNYGDAILGGRTAIDKMLSLFEKYRIAATFAIVGFLFNTDKKGIMSLPELKPSYTDENLNPYSGYLANKVGEYEAQDPYHYAGSLIEKIRDTGRHEIATHTYSHYYCLEKGQTVKQFDADIKFAKEKARKYGIDIRTIVFPRNQHSQIALSCCAKNGISAYRGNEKSWLYKSSRNKEQGIIRRLLRLIDSYLNISGYHCYSVEEVKASFPYNIPSSRFLRPYNQKLKGLEKLKIRRIKNAMTYAAKNNKIYHLWWHPHNFGRNQDKNIKMLEGILMHHESLRKRYNFQSKTMSNLVKGFGK